MKLPPLEKAGDEAVAIDFVEFGFGKLANLRVGHAACMLFIEFLLDFDNRKHLQGSTPTVTLYLYDPCHQLLHRVDKTS